MGNQKKQSVLNGAIILVMSVMLVKVIGVLFKIPMTDMIGTVGRGYFNSAYEIYTPIFAIAMAGLPVAVSRMVAENVALERFREARLVYRVSVRLFLVVGACGTLIMLAIAYPYALYIADIRNLPAILCIAPSIFFCCFMSSYRGYYEGLRNMTPTAISQFLEALGKLCLGLVLIKVVQTYGMNQFEAGMAASGGVSATVFGTVVTNATEANSAITPWASAGAVMGVTLGSVASTVYLAICYKIKGDGFTREQLVNSPRPRDGSVLAKEMIKIAIPMVISALILNITNLIDTATIQARIKSALESDVGFNYITEMFTESFTAAAANNRLNLTDKAEVVKYLWGAYGTSLDFKSLIPTITIQLGVSALPALAAAWAVKNKDEAKSTIETVLRVAMIIALPAGIGIGVLAEPILEIIYGRGSSSDSIAIVAPLMAAYGFATPIIAISTPVTNMLQAIGRTDIPVKSVCVAAVVKIICNYIFVGNYRFNIFGALVGTLLFYVIIVGINLVSLLRVSKVKIHWQSVLIRPLICAVLCGVSAYAANGLFRLIIPAGNLESVLNGNTVSTVISIGFAAVVYLISLLFFKGIKKEDISVLPKGEKIAKVLEKYRLLG